MMRGQKGKRRLVLRARPLVALRDFPDDEGTEGS
jgi:hypothetical protein